MKLVHPVEPLAPAGEASDAAREAARAPHILHPAVGPPVVVAPPAEAPAPGRVRSYEELDGAVGRAVYFRPQRHGAEEFAPLCAAVAVTVDGARRECTLVDVSQNGAAVAWPVGLAVHPGQRVQATVRFDDHTAFDGEVLVGPARQRDGRTVVGLSFIDFLLDIDELLQLRVIGAWAGDGRGARVADKAWCLAGHEGYKSLVSEMRLFLEDAERELTALEAQLPWHVLNGPPNPARAALEQRLRREFVAEAVQHTEEVDAALRLVPGGLANPSAREWALRNLDAFWMKSPSCRWTKEKPFGYPGDYEVMRFLYERQFEGPTLFAKVMGLLFLSTRAAQAVRCRKDLIRREIHALLLRRAGSQGPVRVLSIAAGPAQELHELLLSLQDLPAPLEVVLFEQDKNALTHAWRRLNPTTEARFPHGVRITYLHDSVKRLLRDATLFEGFGRFDLVYSSGLLDYFQRSTAVVLSRRLASLLGPGGHLLMANMVDHPTRWLMEWHLDWNLIYRTRDELLEIGRRAVPGASVRILEEETGINPFFDLTRA